MLYCHCILTLLVVNSLGKIIFYINNTHVDVLCNTFAAERKSCHGMMNKTTKGLCYVRHHISVVN